MGEPLPLAPPPAEVPVAGAAANHHVRVEATQLASDLGEGARRTSRTGRNDPKTRVMASPYAPWASLKATNTLTVVSLGRIGAGWARASMPRQLGGQTGRAPPKWTRFGNVAGRPAAWLATPPR